MTTEQLEAYLNGDLCAERAQDFEEALRHDRNLREAYLGQLEMDATLHVLLSAGGEEGLTAPEFTESVMARLRSEGAAEGTDRRFAKSVLTEILEDREGIRPIRPLRWPDLVIAGVVAAAASIALMFALQGILYPNSGASRGGSVANQESRGHLPSGYIARVQGSSSAQWAATTQKAMRKDGWLSNGMIKLDSGTALIAFNSGATALLEGPASLSLETPNRAFLEYGKLTAEVPEPASGFAVNTPRMNIVDIGTRFGVSVNENGDSDLHVMEGVVEASRSSGNSVTMLVHEGLSFRADSRTRSGMVPIPYEGDSFTLRLSANPQRMPLTALRYQFDESGGAALLDTGRSGLLEASLLPDSSGRIPPRRAPGYSGGGLIIHSGQSLETVLPKKFKLNSAHTISFWMKIPPSLDTNESGSILNFGGEELGWKILCNQNSLDGSQGALRVEFGGKGYVIGSSDLADGQWHQVATRFLGGEDADISSHLHLFVDGKLENLSGWQSTEIDQGGAEVLSLGSADEFGFRGWIDDLRIYLEAISTTSIQDTN